MVDPFLAPLALLAGAGLMLLFATVSVFFKRQPRWNTVRGRQYGWILVFLVPLLLVLLQDSAPDAPHQLLPQLSSTGSLPPLVGQGSQVGRVIGLCYAAVVFGVVLASRGDEREESATLEGSGDRAWYAVDKNNAFLAVVLAVSLVSLLSANPYTLLLSWTLLDAVIAAGWLYELRSSAEGQWRRRLVPWAAGATATLFLWGATLSLQANHGLQRLSSLSLSDWSGIALTLAIIMRLAPFPFQALGSRACTPEEAKGGRGSTNLPLALQTAPAVAGIGLLGQLSGGGALPPVWPALVGALLLTGLAAYGLLAWLSGDDDQTVGWILTAQAGFVVLAGLSAGSRAALAEGVVLILAGAALRLFLSGSATTESRIAGAVGIAAMAGLPLTWGGDGRLALYQNWLDSGRGLYILLAAGASMLTTSAAARIVLRPAAPEPRTVERVKTAAALGILVLGLLLRGGPFLVQVDIAVWLAALIPLGCGALLAWGAPSVAPLQERMPSWVPRLLALEWLAKLIGWLGSAAARAIQAVRQVLEGEGALLWLLFFLALGWMLLASRSPG